jgi:hypothetical protein
MGCFIVLKSFSDILCTFIMSTLLSFLIAECTLKVVLGGQPPKGLDLKLIGEGLTLAQLLQVVEHDGRVDPGPGLVGNQPVLRIIEFQHRPYKKHRQKQKGAKKEPT